MTERAAPEARGKQCESTARRKFAAARRPRPVRIFLLSAAFSLVVAAALAGETTLKPWPGAAPAPFKLDRLSGGHAQLTDVRGQVVLVHFFATWCEPCRAEMASLQRLSERHAGAPLTILAVDVGEVVPRVQRFFAAQPVSFPILLDVDRAVSKAWKVDILPTTIVLDRTLTARYAAEGDADWDHPNIAQTLADLLAARTADVEPEQDIPGRIK